MRRPSLSLQLLLALLVGLVSTAASIAQQLPAQRTIPHDGGRRIIPGHLRPDGFTTLGRIVPTSGANDDYIRNRVLIKTRAYLIPDRLSFSSPILMATLAPYGITGIRQPFPEYAQGGLLHSDRYGLGRIFEVSYRTTIDPHDLAQILGTNIEVEYAEPLYIRHTSVLPSDTRFAEQYVMQKLEAERAWDISTGDTAVKIAIVDSGLDWTHEDIADNVWTNPGEIPGNGKDDDNNGKIDDVRGWDFVGDVSSVETLLGTFREDNNTRIDSVLAERDGRQHGTHVGGTAGAVTNNGKGVAGMGYHCRLIPVKVGSDAIAGSVYRGYEAILYAAKLGANIISCSWGGGSYSQVDQDVIDQATEMGSLVVAATGNESTNIDNFPHFPSGYRNVLAVGATDSQDKPAGFTNFGIAATVYAPGVNILSTVSGGPLYSSTWSGTSMATPTVSGVAGLIKALHPDWRPGQIAHQIRSTADNVVATDSADRPLHFGRVNAYRALAYNRTPLDTLSIPGIGIADVAVNASGGVITDTMPTQVRVTLENYLGDVHNLKVTVISRGDGANVTGGSISIDSILHQGTKEIQLTVQIPPNPYWFQGTANLLVRFESGEYIDYGVISIPYHFPSANKYTLTLSGLPGKTIAHAGYSPAANVLWAVGEVPGLGGGYALISQGNVSYNIVGPTSLNSIYAFDSKKAFATSDTNVFSTINGGTAWKPTSVASITPFINGIHFFNSNDGIFIGEGLTLQQWGIGRTSDGGASWHALPTAVPTTVGGEIMHENSMTWIGDEGWFASDNGRVYHTMNKGETWTSTAIDGVTNITQIAFSSRFEGIVIFSDGVHSYRTASTIDGGATWTLNSLDLATLGVIPVHLAPLSGRPLEYIAMGDDGRVIRSLDNGVTWRGEATFRTDNSIQAGVTFATANSARVWNLGTAVGYLDIPLGVTSVPNSPGVNGNVRLDLR